MRPSEYLAEIEDLKSENKDLRKQLERTSRKLTESQARTKELFDALRAVVNKDHPALRRKK
jgi:cell shape-determining protein MreC